MDGCGTKDFCYQQHAKMSLHRREQPRESLRWFRKQKKCPGTQWASKIILQRSISCCTIWENVKRLVVFEWIRSILRGLVLSVPMLHWERRVHLFPWYRILKMPDNAEKDTIEFSVGFHPPHICCAWHPWCRGFSDAQNNAIIMQNPLSTFLWAWETVLLVYTAVSMEAMSIEHHVGGGLCLLPQTHSPQGPSWNDWHEDMWNSLKLEYPYFDAFSMCDSTICFCAVVSWKRKSLERVHMKLSCKCWVIHIEFSHQTQNETRVHLFWRARPIWPNLEGTSSRVFTRFHSFWQSSSTTHQLNGTLILDHHESQHVGALITTSQSSSF